MRRVIPRRVSLVRNHGGLQACVIRRFERASERQRTGKSFRRGHGKCVIDGRLTKASVSEGGGGDELKL